MVTFLSSCSVFKKTAKWELSDGFYIQKTSSEKRKVFVDVVDDEVKIYPTKKENNEKIIDTLTYQTFHPEFESIGKIDFSLTQKNFDIDFITIPLKFRFAEKDVPSQLNPNINGAVYIGYRTDVYDIDYYKNPLKRSVREIQRIGYSFGIFSGFGNTFMSPTNTFYRMEQEYDGVVWTKGVAGFIAFNNFNVGITIGFDNLLDRNRNIWIYESKPWIGVGFGLNLN